MDGSMLIDGNMSKEGDEIFQSQGLKVDINGVLVYWLKKDINNTYKVNGQYYPQFKQLDKVNGVNGINKI